jgi:hypothetical protein
MTAVLGEITSVEIDDSGRYLLAGCKDNSNRLYDLRMVCQSVLLELVLTDDDSIIISTGTSVTRIPPKT